MSTRRLSVRARLGSAVQKAAGSLLTNNAVSMRRRANRPVCELLEERRLLTTPEPPFYPPFCIPPGYSAGQSGLEPIVPNPNRCPQPLAQDTRSTQGGGPDGMQLAAGANQDSEAPVRYADGQIVLGSTDLQANGFGMNLGVSRSYIDPNTVLFTSEDFSTRYQSISGNGWFANQIPQLSRTETQHQSTTVGSITTTTWYEYLYALDTAVNYRVWDRLWTETTDNSTHQITGPTAGAWAPLWGYNKDTLVEDDYNHQFIIIDTNGGQMVYHDFTIDLTGSPYSPGRFEHYVSPFGQTILTTENASGQITKISASSEEFDYTYLASPDPNAGMLSGVQLKNATGGASIVRQVVYSYYDGISNTTGGTLGQLRSVTIEDGSGTPIDTTYYRYYAPLALSQLTYNSTLNVATATVASGTTTFQVGDSVDISGANQPEYNGTFTITAVSGNTFSYVPNGTPAVSPATGTITYEPTGSQGSLKMVFNSDATARALAAGVNPGGNVADSTLRPFADNYFEYDTRRRVSRETVQGAGCSCTGGGTGTYIFTYATPQAPTDLNQWRYQTTEQRPDGSYVIVFENWLGEVLFKGTFQNHQTWGTFYEHLPSSDPSMGASIEWVAEPSAFRNLPDSPTTTVNDVVAALSSPDVVGYDSGTNTFQYLNPTGGLYEGYEYVDGISGTGVVTFQGSQNFGSATAEESAAHSGRVLVTVTYGDPGNPQTVQVKGYVTTSETQFSQGGGLDPGRVTSYSYSPSSGPVTGVTITMPPITAVEDGPASSTSDAAHADVVSETLDAYGDITSETDGNGIVTSYTYSADTGALTQETVDPTGLDLVTQYTVDALGRPTKIVRGFGRADQRTDYIVYNDVNHEERYYPGWNSATNTTTGPIQVTRHYRPTTGTAITGTASSGSTTTLTDATHLSSSGSYVGYTLVITGGTDVGLVATVTSYNGSTHTLTFSPPFANSIDNTSTYILANATVYDETLTSSAAPAVTGGVPNGTETINETNIESLSRDLTNIGGQVMESDNYFSLAGATYAQSAIYLGSASNNTASGNYHATLFGYDDLGDQNMEKMPTGTIYRTVYDALQRPISHWVGTDDSHTGDDWTPTTNIGNMVNVEDEGYDSQNLSPAPVLGEVTDPTGQTINTVFYVSVTLTIGGVETPAGPVSVLSMQSAQLLTVSVPSSTSVPAGTTFNVYVGTTPGMLTEQPASGSVGTTWQEPSPGVGQTTGMTTNGNFVNYSGVGDGNLTMILDHPGGSDADRDTQMLYDWRNRLIAEKQGVSASESDGTHRPIYYFALDNLGEVTNAYQYDGDGIALSDFANFASLPPADAAKLVAETGDSYDDQGRVYESQVFNIDATTHTANGSLKTFTWYDHDGNVMKTLSPGGLVRKYIYDAEDRQTKAYVTDGGGDTAPQSTVQGTGGVSQDWIDAGNVTGDIVLSQVETQYDSDSNPTLVTDRERFNTDTSAQTGDLGTPSTGNPARVYYSADYYDSADRLTDSVDFGTNGATVISTPPALTSLPAGSLHTVYGYAGDNVQIVTITGSPTGGSFTLTFNGQTTAAITYPATAASVQSKLAALSSIGSAANVMVSSPSTGTYVIRFTGTLGGKYEPAITANGAGLTGGSHPAASVKLSNLGGDANTQQTVTDPRGISTKTDVDLLGRTTRTVGGHTASGSSIASIDQTTDYTYDGDNHTLTMTAENPGSTPSFQTTQWVYGLNVAAVGYGIFSNDLMSKVMLPDPTTGQPSGATGNFETYGYDDLGEVHKNFHDENGDVALYLYDVLGRLVQQQIGVLGSGVDGAVRSLAYTYDPNGQFSTASSYNGFNGGTVLNQVKEVYNGLGQLVGEYQSHSGAVTIGTTPEVQYLYQSMTGSTSDGRATGMIYPNARQVDYQYNTGLDSNISRVSSINDDAGTGSGSLESYSYLGLDTIVQRTRPNNTDLTYIGSSSGPAGDKYVGLDAFGRVVDQNWQTTGSGAAIDRYQYGYDADSNVLYRLNLSSGTNASNFSELYHPNGSTNGYDALNRLLSFSRGVLNGTNDTISSPTKTITWNLDSVGNWSGANAVVTNGTAQSRSANGRNEYTAVGSSTPTFDHNGNLTKDENGQQYVYDAWNRLKQVKNSAGTVLVTYSYDPLGRRIVEAVNGGATTDVYFNGSNVIEERQGSTVTSQYVWGLGYQNDLILRDRNADSNSGTGSYGKTGSGLEERLFVQQDSNFNVTAIVDTGGNIVERFAYDAYGARQVLDANWNAISDSKAWIYSFQGGRQDPTSGLIHFGTPGRDYSTSLGRWTEADPIGYGDGPNVYQMEQDNPASRLDGLGTCARYNQDDCTELYQEIMRLAQQLNDKLMKYDPVRDGIGGDTYRAAGKLYKTKPGSHFDDIMRRERSLQEKIDEFDEKCGGTDPDGRKLPKSLRDMAHKRIPFPVYPDNPWWSKGGRSVSDGIDTTSKVFFGIGVTAGTLGVGLYAVGGGGAAAAGATILGRIGPPAAAAAAAAGRRAAAAPAPPQNPTTQPSCGCH